MKTPVIYNRKFDDLVNQIEKMVPYYTPEWRFNRTHPDVGTAFFMIMALQMEETIDLLNQTLDNHFLAYLNLIQLKLRPSKPARVPLVFRASDGTTQLVTMAKGSRMIGKSDTLPDEISFELENELHIHPSQIKAFYEGDQKCNAIREIGLDQVSDFFSDTENQQENSLYLESDSLYHLHHPATIRVSFSEPEGIAEVSKLADSDFATWHYWNLGNWVYFDDVSWDGSELILMKRKALTIEPYAEDKGPTIRCLLKPEALKACKNIRISRVQSRSMLVSEEGLGVEPDALYHNGDQIRRPKIYPFGMFFNQLGTFEIYSNDVLSKRGSKIQLSFDLIFEPNKNQTLQPDIDWKLIMKKSEFHRFKENIISIFDVKWKYYNGITWVPLEVPVAYERLFYYQNEKAQITMSFVCPEDIQALENESGSNYGIQAEIQRIENPFAPNGVHMSPVIENMRLQYLYESDRNLDDMYTFNNLERQSLYVDLVNQSQPIPLFMDLAIEDKAIYVMLDQIYDTGNLNLLMALKRKLKFEEAFHMDVSVLAHDHYQTWQPIDFKDDTMGLTRTGIIQLMINRVWQPATYFGKKGVWLRITLKGTENTVRRQFEHIHLNAVWSRQVQTVDEEILPYKSDQVTYQLNAFPVHKVEVSINEIDHISQSQAEALILSDVPTAYVRDDYGHLEEIWVTWSEIDSFVHSDHHDRVYLLNHLTGEITFGDGNRTRKLPVGNGQHIRVKYQTTYGNEGNLPPYEIKQMEQSKAFVDQVFNPISSEGGTDFESLETAKKRGLVKIRSRGMAISGCDYEDILLAEFPNLQRVKCYGNRSETFDYCPGKILLILVPYDRPENGIDYETQTEITRFLKRMIPAGLPLKNLILMDPAMIEVSLRMQLHVQDASKRIQVKEEVLKRLENFLDYRTGAFDGKGFSIGDLPGMNSFFTLFKDIEGLANVGSMAVTLLKIEHLEKTEIAYEDVSKLLNGLVVNGVHTIDFI